MKSIPLKRIKRILILTGFAATIQWGFEALAAPPAPDSKTFLKPIKHEVIFSHGQYMSTTEEGAKKPETNINIYTNYLYHLGGGFQLGGQIFISNSDDGAGSKVSISEFGPLFAFNFNPDISQSFYLLGGLNLGSISSGSASTSSTGFLVGAGFKMPLNRYVAFNPKFLYQTKTLKSGSVQSKSTQMILEFLSFSVFF